MRNYNNIIDNKKPTILVFPAFLAVGGVEKNTLSVIKELKKDYNFIVISTEELQESQGSMLAEYLSECLVLPLDIISTRSQYLDILSHLNVLFAPDFVWICNGSVWLNNNIANLKKIFDNSHFIDQQIYDTEGRLD